jgi:hypothetical protein
MSLPAVGGVLASGSDVGVGDGRCRRRGDETGDGSREIVIEVGGIGAQFTGRCTVRTDVTSGRFGVRLVVALEFIQRAEPLVEAGCE